MVATIIKRKKYIRAFVKAGVTREENAASLQNLGLHHSRQFEKMVRRQMVINEGKDKYYLNMPIVEMYRDTRNHFLRIVLIIIVLFILAFVIARLTR
jgi:hypothetical protein